MVGEMKIEIKNLSILGARVSADVEALHVVGGGEVHPYNFSLTITCDLQEEWNIADAGLEEALKELVAEIYSPGVGLTWTVPEGGYWFDRHNSLDTIKGTVDKMRNEGRTWFLRNPASEDRISAIYGGAILAELEDADTAIFRMTGMRLLSEPDRAFERSQAVYDLSTEPKTDQDLINKTSILGVVIDNFGVRRSEDSKMRDRLEALKNWLAEQYGQEEAELLIEPFIRVRALRNQYPIHDRYQSVKDGKAQERNRVKTAGEFFGFEKHHDSSAKWKRVCDAFRLGVQELSNKIVGTTK